VPVRGRGSAIGLGPELFTDGVGVENLIGELGAAELEADEAPAAVEGLAGVDGPEWAAVGRGRAAELGAFREPADALPSAFVSVLVGGTVVLGRAAPDPGLLPGADPRGAGAIVGGGGARVGLPVPIGGGVGVHPGRVADDDGLGSLCWGARGVFASEAASLGVGFIGVLCPGVWGSN